MMLNHKLVNNLPCNPPTPLFPSRLINILCIHPSVHLSFILHPFIHPVVNQPIKVSNNLS